MRGREPWTLEGLAAGILPVAAAGLLGLRAIRKGEAHFQFSRVRVVLLLLIYFAAALAYALRADRVQAITTSMILDIFGYLAALGALLTVAFSIPRASTTKVLCMVTLVASTALALHRGSGPPVFEPPASLATNPPTRAPTRAPNVVLIVLDTVRAKNLDIYGYPKPTLAKTGAYLKEGLIFDAATASGTFFAYLPRVAVHRPAAQRPRRPYDHRRRRPLRPSVARHRNYGGLAQRKGLRHHGRERQ